MVVVLAVWLLAACGGASSAPLEPSAPASESSAALAPELVGSWETEHWLDSTGSRAIVRTYRFTADGHYEYTLAQCQSSTDCAIQSSEQGSVQAAGGIVSLRPQPASADGPRSYPYVVGRDPNVGDLQLHLTLADGEIDIFYAAQCSPPEIRCRYRARESRISSAVFFQTNGFGLSFHCPIQSRTSASSAWTDLWALRWSFWVVR